MKIDRKTIISPMTSDEKVMKVGKKYIFNANGKCHVGTFLGLGKTGSVMFKGIIAGAEVEFNVMPNSITEIFESEV